MKIVYHRTKYGMKKFTLHKRADRRWHKVRQLVNQLLTHDRIETCHKTALHIVPTVERVISLGKKFVNTENQHFFRMVNRRL